MKKLFLIVITALMFSAACEDLIINDLLKEEDKEKGVSQNVVTYTIRKGNHESDQSSYRKMTVDTISFNAMFDSSAVYQTMDPSNQGDINKLYGLSDCGNSHHTNSARFGWRWYKNQLEIWAYSYLNGDRKMEKVGVVSLHELHTFKIIFGTGEYVFILDDVTVKLPRACEGTASGYKLYPYFGGDELAPHDVNITIEDI